MPSDHSSESTNSTNRSQQTDSKTPTPVWQNPAKGTPRASFVAFSAGRDVVGLPESDSALVPYDIWTNRAHAMGLRMIGVYEQNELKQVSKALRELETLWNKGEWELDSTLEDVHTNIEAFITERCGAEIGGKLHTGRSRNDQVATDMKLLARDALLGLIDETSRLASHLCKLGSKHKETVMPGYTHHRKATITTWGHWCAAYAQGFLRDAERFADILKRINTCPLGAAASYGTTWPLDRDYVANLLAFEAPQDNTLDAVSSRGEAECEIMQAASLLMKRLSQLSQDLILFSTEEFGYLSLPGDFTTGSSIMPQKRNPDFAEAVKGKAHVVFGCANTLLSMNSGNLAGYNKDVQWSKYVFLDGLRECSGAAGILTDVMRGLEVDERKMLEASTRGFLNAVDIADYLAKNRDLPFRATYQLLSEAVGISKSQGLSRDQLNALLEQHEIRPLTAIEFHALHNPKRCMRQRDHVGSPHPRRVRDSTQRMDKQVKSLNQFCETMRKEIKKMQTRCERTRL